MKLEIFAEDKPAEKVFEYKLEVADNVLLLSTAMLSGVIALQLVFSLERLTDSLYFPFENRGFSVLSDLISVFFGTGLCYNF